MTVDITPVHKSIRVPCTPQVAFKVFTEEIATWWPLMTHSVGAEKATGCGIEPGVGGELYEVDAAGERGKWGTVTEWDPPRLLSFEWHPGRDAAGATRVSVSFVSAGDHTDVALTHDEWWKLGEKAQEMRDNYDGGWDGVFSTCFKKACESAA